MKLAKKAYLTKKRKVSFLWERLSKYQIVVEQNETWFTLAKNLGSVDN